MTPSIASFERAASLKPQGELQVNQNQIENRGTLGNRLINAFRTLGAWLGVCSKPASEQARQVEVLEAFRQALTTQYGTEISGMALQDVRGPLTGNKVDQVLSTAKGAQSRNRNHFNNEQKVALMLPGEYLSHAQGKDVSLRSDALLADAQVGQTLQTTQESERNFAGLCEQAKIKDVQSFATLFDATDNRSPKNGHTLYRDMLLGLARTVSFDDAKSLDLAEARQAATGVLKAMRPLDSAEKVARAHLCFNDYAQALRDMMADIAAGRDDDLEVGKERAVSALKHLTTAFKLGSSIIGDDGWAIGSAAFGKALADLPAAARSGFLDRLAGEDNPLEDPSLDSIIYVSLKNQAIFILEGRQPAAAG